MALVAKMIGDLKLLVKRVKKELGIVIEKAGGGGGRTGKHTAQEKEEDQGKRKNPPEEFNAWMKPYHHGRDTYFCVYTDIRWGEREEKTPENKLWIKKSDKTEDAIPCQELVHQAKTNIEDGIEPTHGQQQIEQRSTL
ncbi:hypothetical protein WN51_07998 [Melipona quadrifasciata]|uniref:Uncharacterized protein n=1 Tax=Melipona quadrifasciata TaxID=166423 RepID=A0A0N0BBU6_9HYME|nr:hypothetical protein WN51_07998 [Melipona quadrifasciata]